MAEACTKSLVACVQSPTGCLEGISVLIAYGAEVTHPDLIRLAKVCKPAELKECFISALSSVDNPFVLGMTLSVAFDDAAPKAGEREGRTLSVLMQTVDDVLLEVLERLPQTIRTFAGGVDGCAVVFEPETTGALPASRAGPLTLALHERQFTETFCVAPLVFEYLNHQFVSGLPNILDREDFLGRPRGDENVSPTSAHYGQAYLFADGLVADGPLAKQMQGLEIRAPRADGLLSQTTGWARMFISGTLLAGAQFVAVGILTKPMRYYKVAVIRLALDVIVHLTMLWVYTRVVLKDAQGGLTKSEVVLTFHVTVRS